MTKINRKKKANRNHAYELLLVGLLLFSCKNKICMNNDYMEVCFNLPQGYILQEKNPDCVQSYLKPCRKYVFEDLDYIVEVAWEDTNSIDLQFSMYKDIYGFRDLYDARSQSYIYFTEHSGHSWYNFERVDTIYSSKAKFVKIIQNKSGNSVVFKFFGYQVGEIPLYKKYTESIIKSIQIQNGDNIPKKGNVPKELVE